MAEEYFGAAPPPPGEPPEERKRRLMTMYEMTGNPFTTGSPFLPRSASQRGGGASGSWEDQQDAHQPRFAPPVDIPALAPQQATSAALRGTPAAPRAAAAAADTSLTSIPTQGPQGSRSAPSQAYGQSSPAAGAAPAADPRQRLFDQMQRNIDDTKMPDMTQAVDAYRRRYQDAGGDIAVGWMMGERGGRTGRELGGQILKQALAARSPQTTDYGTLDASGFTSDPMKEREFKIARGEKMIAQLEAIASHSENEKERREARIAADQLRRDTLQMHRETLAATREQGKFAHFADPDTGQVVLYNTKTGERVAAPGGGGSPGTGAGQPAPMGLKLTESQGKAFDAADKIHGALPILSNFPAAPSAKAIAALTTSNPVARAALNKALSADEQAFVNAASLVLAGVLRKESGAAITKEEWHNYGPTYLPWYGDDPTTIANKMKVIKSTGESYTQQSGPQGGRELQRRFAPKPPPDLRPSALPQATRPKGTTAERSRSYMQQAEG